MPDIRISPARRFAGEPEIPGDKSISHRSLLFGALAEGTTEITHLLESGDVRSTASCLGQMGVRIEPKGGGKTLVHGTGKLAPPKELLDCGNSGTTMRSLMGVLAGREGLTATLSGDSSLVRRPMKRVAEPLRKMGAEIELSQGDFAPLTIRGTRLRGVEYELKIASAQIKTAILLAGL